MPSPFIGGRIPQELHDALQKHIENSGERLPYILQQSLSNYLNYTPTVDKKQAGLEDRLSVLEEEFQKLKLKVDRVEVLESPPQQSEVKEKHSQLPIPDVDNRIDIKHEISQVSEKEADNNTDNESDISGKEFKHEQVAEMVGKSLPAVRADHRRNKSLTNDSYRFLPSGIPNHPKWIAEKMITD